MSRPNKGDRPRAVSTISPAAIMSTRDVGELPRVRGLGPSTPKLTGRTIVPLAKGRPRKRIRPGPKPRGGVSPGTDSTKRLAWLADDAISDLVEETTAQAA
jgi:hypothetical protein